MNKKTLEKKVLEKFQVLYPLLPKESTFKFESPDFLITVAEKKIGIELVQLIQSINELPTLIQIENTQDYLLNVAQKHFESIHSEPYWVDILFSHYSEVVYIKNKDDVAKEIAEKLKEYLPLNTRSGRIENDFQGLFPNFITSIYVTKLPSEAKHKWSTTRAGYMQEGIISLIQNVIDSKKNKYSYYLKNCNECWLLIFSLGRAPSSFIEADKESKAYTYSSNFDKTFYLDCFKDELTELNTRQRSSF